MEQKEAVPATLAAWNPATTVEAVKTAVRAAARAQVLALIAQLEFLSERRGAVRAVHWDEDGDHDDAGGTFSYATGITLILEGGRQLCVNQRCDWVDYEDIDWLTDQEGERFDALTEGPEAIEGYEARNQLASEATRIPLEELEPWMTMLFDVVEGSVDSDGVRGKRIDLVDVGANLDDWQRQQMLDPTSQTSVPG